MSNMFNVAKSSIGDVKVSPLGGAAAVAPQPSPWGELAMTLGKKALSAGMDGALDGALSGGAAGTGLTTGAQGADPSFFDRGQEALMGEDSFLKEGKISPSMADDMWDDEGLGDYGNLPQTPPPAREMFVPPGNVPLGTGTNLQLAPDQQEMMLKRMGR